MDVPTTAERHAIAFLVAVAVLGAGVRVVQAHHASEALQEMLRAPARETSAGRASAPVTAPAAAARDAAQAEARTEARTEVRNAARTVTRSALHDQLRRADSAHRATPPPVKKLAPGAAPIAINTATALELRQLPRVGPALAARIVANRDSLGPFTSLEDLTRVRGIGPAMAQKLAPLVVFRPNGR